MIRSTSKVCIFLLFALLVISLTWPQEVHISYASETRTISLTPIDDAYVDSTHPNTNYGYQTTVSIENYQGPLSSRKIETWLKFSLSSIPPEATIQSATLSITLYSLPQSMDLTVCRSTDISWSESAITYNSTLRNTLPPEATYTDRVTMTSVQDYTLSITSDLENAVPTGVLTEVLRIYPPIGNDMLASFYSKEHGIQGPTLVIIYTYVSSSIMLSSNSIAYGQSVVVTGITDPHQTSGTMTLQYSTDQLVWGEITSTAGGTCSFPWSPPTAGTFYIRSVWRITWAGGSYAARSDVPVLTVAKVSSLIFTSLSAKAITPDKPVTITTTLIPPLSGTTVTLEYSTDGSNYLLVGEGNVEGGMNKYEWIPPGLGRYYVRARWDGTISYSPATSIPQTLVVALVVTTLTLSTPSTAKVGETITTTATMKDNNGNPMPGHTINFMLNSTSIGQATTSSSGLATLSYKLAVRPGIYTISTLFAGSEKYPSAENSATLVLNPLRLVVASTVIQAPIISLDGREYTSDPLGKATIFINITGRYTLRANSPVPLSPGVRSVFQQWTDGITSPTRVVIVDSDQSLSIITEIQYYLVVNANGGVVSDSGWYESGSTAIAYAESPCKVVKDRSRLVFSKWSGDSTSTSTDVAIILDSPKSIVANWKTEYYLRVSSQYGETSGEGWHEAGSMVKFSVTSPIGTLVQQVCTGWSGDSSATTSAATILMDGPKTVVAKWQTDYTQVIILVMTVVGIASLVVITVLFSRWKRAV